MPKYYVNTQAQFDSGDHEVHKEGCSWLAKVEKPEYLGEFPSCHAAVAEAKSRGYATADGCYYCCGACHTS